MIILGKLFSSACRSLPARSVVTLLFLGCLATTAAAAPSGGLAAGVFEIDGNLVSEDSTRIDWFAGSFGPAAGVIDPDSCRGRVKHLPAFLDAEFYRDDHWAGNAVDATTFAGSSNKNNDCISVGSEPWSLGPGSGPGKTDLTEAYSASYVDPVTGDNWLLLGFATRSTNGDSEMDFEFNTAGLSVNASGTQLSGPGPDCGRTIGDFIVSIGFVGGGTLPQPDIYTWNGTAFELLDITPPSGEAPRFLVAVNNAPVPAPCSAIAPDGTFATQYATRQFAEIAINLTKAGVDLVDYCGKPQSTLGFKTRTSAGFSSELKDVKLFPFHLVPSTESTITGPTSLCAHEATTLVGPDSESAPSPLSYLWSTGATTSSIELTADGLGVGEHTVWLVVQNQFGCRDSSAVVVNVHPEMQASIAPVGVCTGETGTLTAVVTNGSGTLRYAWSNGASTPSIDVGQAGEYCVTVTDANGCEARACGTLTVHAPLIVEVADQAVCAGETGTLTAVVTSGGTAPFTYAWGNGKSSQAIDTTVAGEYCVTVTDVNGCQGRACGSLTVRPALQVDVADVAVCAGESGTLRASVDNGTAPFTYAWSNGATADSTVVSESAPYSVTVTDANGCTGTATATFTVRAAIKIVLGDVEVCAGETAILGPVISNAAAPMTCLWSTGATTPALAVTQSGEYSVVVTDANGCEARAAATVTVHAPVEVAVAAIAVCAGETGTLRATVTNGEAPLTYAWSNGATSDHIEVGTPGEYCVTVTDANGCQGQVCTTFTVRPELQVSVADAAVCAGESGTLHPGVTNGTGPFTYEWSNGATSESIVVSTSGKYTVRVTDANGCAGTATATFTVRAPIDVVLGDIEICAGETATLVPRVTNAGTPMACLWSTGATSATLAVTQSGEYSVVVTDCNGCVGRATATVIVHQPLEVTASDLEVCAGETATLRAIVASGEAPFRYSWSNGSTSDRISPTASGNYCVTVTDANGCSGQTCATLTVHDLPAVTVRDVEVCEGNSGTLSAKVTGGLGPYTYAWSTGETGRYITNSRIGEYCVTVTDVNGCQGQACGYILRAGMPVCEIQGPSWVCMNWEAQFSFEVPSSVPVASLSLPTRSHPPAPTVAEVSPAVSNASPWLGDMAQPRTGLVAAPRGDDAAAAEAAAAKVGLDEPPSVAGLTIEWSVSDPDHALIQSSDDQPTLTVRFTKVGRYEVRLKLTSKAGCVSECSMEVVVLDCNAPGCPRTVGFWGRQCVQSGNGDTKFTRSEMYRIVGCVDAHSLALDLGGGRNGFEAFCTLIDTDDMNQRHQAKRQFAGMLANVCAGNLGLVASNGDSIRLVEPTPIHFPPFEARTIGALIEEIDALLLDLEPLSLEDADVKSQYSTIIRVADDINNGRGIGETCAGGDGEGDARPDPVPGLMALKPTPNPFTLRTTILYTVTGAAAQHVDISVYDIAGRRVRVLENGMRQPGNALTYWDGRDGHGVQLARGVYYVRGELGGQRFTTRVVLLRQ